MRLFLRAEIENLIGALNGEATDLDQHVVDATRAVLKRDEATADKLRDFWELAIFSPEEAEDFRSRLTAHSYWSAEEQTLLAPAFVVVNRAGYLEQQMSSWRTPEERVRELADEHLLLRFMLGRAAIITVAEEA